jgi:putative ABC transport system permease protein
MSPLYYIRIFFIAAKSLLDDFGRTLLSLLGIIVSVLAIMIVITLGDNVDLYIQNQLSAFGTDSIQIEIKVPSDDEGLNIGDASSRAQIDTLTADDARALEKLPNVSVATVGMVGQSRMVSASGSKQALLLGADGNAPQVDSGIKIADGRFFTSEEAEGKSHVLVLGSNLAEELFENTSAIGERVRVNGTTYRIIGTLKERGSLFGFNYDDLAYIPYTALSAEILGIDYVQYITAKATSNETVDAAVGDITSVLRVRHDSNGPGEDDFSVTSTEEAQDLLGNIVGVVSLLLTALASVSIIVGGVGIMNMMLMSVEERKAEIGLRKALGGRPEDILSQFLIESVVIALFAAVIGITLAALILYFAGTYAVAEGYVESFRIPLKAILLSAGFSCAAGVLFGVYPARTAARTNPVEAMR